MRSPADSPPDAPERPRKLPLRVGWVRRQFSDILFVARRDRKWWLLPLLFLVLMLAGLMIFASVLGPLAPFVYPFL